MHERICVRLHVENFHKKIKIKEFCVNQFHPELVTAQLRKLGQIKFYFILPKPDERKIPKVKKLKLPKRWEIHICDDCSSKSDSERERLPMYVNKHWIDFFIGKKLKWNIRHSNTHIGRWISKKSLCDGICNEIELH